MGACHGGERHPVKQTLQIELARRTVSCNFCPKQIMCQHVERLIQRTLGITSFRITKLRANGVEPTQIVQLLVYNIHSVIAGGNITAARNRNEDCAICLERMGEDFTLFVCGRCRMAVHADCFNTWVTARRKQTGDVRDCCVLCHQTLKLTRQFMDFSETKEFIANTKVHRILNDLEGTAKQQRNTLPS